MDKEEVMRNLSEISLALTMTNAHIINIKTWIEKGGLHED